MSEGCYGVGGPGQLHAINIDEQIKAVGREIGLRKAVYPRFIKSGKISQEKADHELQAMAAVYETLKQLRDGHRAPASLLDVLTRLQASATPTDNEAQDAVVPATMWREFVNAHAAALYTSARPVLPHRSGGGEVPRRNDGPASANLNPAAAWPFPKGPRT